VQETASRIAPPTQGGRTPSTVIRTSSTRPEAFRNGIVRNLLVDRSRRLGDRMPHVPIDGPSARKRH
jgi:hypothetical protein